MLLRGAVVGGGPLQQRSVVRAVQPRPHVMYIGDTNPLPQPQQGLFRPCSRVVQCRVFDKFKDMLGGKSQQQASSSSSSVSSWEHPEDQSMEEDEGAEMVPLDLDSRGGLGGTSADVLGPLAVLLVGYSGEEFEQFRSMMIGMEADMVKMIPCTSSMLKGTLQAAMEADCPVYEQPPLGQQRAVFMSGMYGSEVVEVIAAYRDAGLPPTVFAAAVPNNWQRTVEELINSVWKDQAAMNQRMALQQAQQQGAPEES